MPLSSLSPRAVVLLRTAVYAAFAAAFLGTGIAVLVREGDPLPPPWLYAGGSLLGAAALFALARLAPPRSVAVAYDEGAERAWLHAQAFGYWVAVAGFVLASNAVALGLAPFGPAFALAGMATGAAPFVHVLVAQARGRG